MADATIGRDTVAVTVDVVVLDPSGYVGRYVLWDKPDLTAADAELLAGPIVRALEQELGKERVVGVELWHLRSGGQMFVASSTAVARLGEADLIIDSYDS